MQITTDYGTWTWDGNLTPQTIITVADGSEVSYANLITLTNGDALEIMANLDNVQKYAEGQPRDSHGRFSGSGRTLDGQTVDFWGAPPTESVIYERKKTVVSELTERMQKTVSDQQFIDYWENTQGVVWDNKVWQGKKSPEDIHCIVNIDNSEEFMSFKGAMNYLNIKTSQKDFTFDEAQKLLQDKRAEFESANRANERVGFPNLAATPEGMQMIREGVVNNLVATWAGTSNDNNSRALSIQDIAQETFDLKDTSKWRFSSPRWETELKPKMDAFKAANGDIIKSFLQSQYDNTQAYLKSKGITKVVLFRGIDSEFSKSEFVGKYPAKLRPLSSWSTHASVALNFAPDNNILKITVDAKNVFSTAMTGTGCLNEKEVVLLGGIRDIEAGSVDFDVNNNSWVFDGGNP